MMSPEPFLAGFASGTDIGRAMYEFLTTSSPRTRQFVKLAADRHTGAAPRRSPGPDVVHFDDATITTLCTYRPVGTIQPWLSGGSTRWCSTSVGC